MFAALILTVFIASAEAEPLDILAEEPVGICTPSGCPIGGHPTTEKPSDSGKE